jgi:SAM-dependent methyltransferase
MTELLPCSPAAERNKRPILEVLRAALPGAGTVLEVASGTGQHVMHFAAALPGLAWQPSERDPARLGAIAERLARTPLPNVRAPIALDVFDDPWPLADCVAAVIAINLIHIAPWAATAALCRGARRQLGAGGGILVLYGPFKERGMHTAPSNAAFDESLRVDDPAWGVRDLDEVAAVAAGAGFAAPRLVRMPANNLTVTFGLDPARERRG